MVPRHPASLVGPHVRDHGNPGPRPRTRAVLLGLYRSLATAFPRVGDTGIRFRIADVDVDLLPFGDIEDPQGIVEPPKRGETLSVWAFEEIFTASLPLALTATTTIRIPTVAGFAVAKLGAWLDRSDWLEARDAADLALILHWYAESADVHDRIYQTSTGSKILLAEVADVPLAAAHLLGMDVADTIGTARLTEAPCPLAPRPGPADPRAGPSRRTGLAT